MFLSSELTGSDRCDEDAVYLDPRLPYVDLDATLPNFDDTEFIRNDAEMPKDQKTEDNTGAGDGQQCAIRRKCKNNGARQ